MTKYPDIFNETYSSLVSAGDSSGNLDVIFNQLADYLEESAVTRQKVISALTYPLILVSFSIIVIIGLLYFVLPQVIGQFMKAGAEQSTQPSEGTKDAMAQLDTGDPSPKPGPPGERGA